MADTVAEAKEVKGALEEKKVEEVDEDSKTSENSDDKPCENGTVDEGGDDESKDAEPESTENGDIKASTPASAKRKSGGGDAPEATTPEKKAKVDEKADSAEANGEVEATA